MRQSLRSLFVGLLFGLCMPSGGQLRGQDAAERYTDSLLSSAMQAQTEELKIEGLLKVSLFWSDQDTARAYQYLEQARREMGKTPEDFQMGLYRLYLANILMEYDIRQAKVEFLAADSLLATSSAPKSYFYRSKLWNNYGVMVQKEDKGGEFMEVIVSKALPYARLAGDSTSVAHQLHNIALQLGNVQDYNKASSYYKAALHTLKNLANREENKLETFTLAARNAILAGNFSIAKTYLDSARQLMPRVQHSSFIPTFYRTELSYFRHAKNKSAALESYRKGILSAEKVGDEYMLRDLNFELHALYRDFGEYQKAKEHLLLSDTYEPFPNAQNRALYHREMGNLEYQLGDYKAAYHQMDSLYKELESIYEKDMAAKVLDLEKKYNTSEKENRILRLEATNQQQQLKIAGSRWRGLVLGAGLVLTLCIAFFAWKINKKNQKVFAQKELLHKEELLSLRQRERLREYDAMLQGQEAERNRLARDLHDGLGGLLAGVKLKLSSIVTKSGGNMKKANGAVDQVIHQLDYSVDELRRIAHDMMPESLRYGGLAPALSDLCRYMDTPEINVSFQDLGLNEHYPEQLRVTVYRIVQELLTNAVKHSNASEVILQCSELDGWLFITVEDNGNGMEAAIETATETGRDDPGNGLGLMNIRNRVALLDGNIEIQSQTGDGTTFNIQIPINGERTN